ncbi:MAG TPA: hypothetical protein VE977_07675 [Pyrinomonadaceae bacterium]|nr:hypothetical protein [Pyrinomonadaceae bacterium]
MMDCIEGEHHIDRARFQRELASISQDALESGYVGDLQETSGLCKHILISIEAGQMKLRHRLQ